MIFLNLLNIFKDNELIMIVKAKIKNLFKNFLYETTWCLSSVRNKEIFKSSGFSGHNFSLNHTHIHLSYIMRSIMYLILNTFHLNIDVVFLNHIPVPIHTRCQTLVLYLKNIVLFTAHKTTFNNVTENICLEFFSVE